MPWQPDETYLNLVMDFIPQTVYGMSRHYAKAKKTFPLLYMKVGPARRAARTASSPLSCDLCSHLSSPPVAPAHARPVRRVERTKARDRRSVRYESGDWIIQEKLSNDAFLSTLLPEDAPLSTFRVITSSRVSLDGDGAEVRALSCVFRAGMKHAVTDHQAVLFDVDRATGRILKGTTNQNWYRLGLDKIFSTPWFCWHTSLGSLGQIAAMSSSTNYCN